MDEYLCSVAEYRQASRSLHILDGDGYVVTLRNVTELWSHAQYISEAMISHQEMAHGLKLKPKRTPLLMKQLGTFRTWLERRFVPNIAIR
jgi:hypothetical protein